MNILSKNSVRTIAVGVVALSISSLGSLAFASPKVCREGYMQTATVHGKSLADALDLCYVKKVPGPAVEACAQRTFRDYYRKLQDEIDKFQRCSVAPTSQ